MKTQVIHKIIDNETSTIIEIDETFCTNVLIEISNDFQDKSGVYLTHSSLKSLIRVLSDIDKNKDKNAGMD